MPTADFDERLDRLTTAIAENTDISEENKEILSKFKRDLSTEGYSKARIHKLLTHLKIIAEWASWDFDEADEEDLRDAVEWIQERDLAPQTKLDYKVVIKRFYKWMNGDEEHPEMVKWIKTTGRYTDRKLPEDLLEEDDVLNLLDHTKNRRTAAFMSILWETGARAGELLDLEIRHLQDHEYGYKIVINGKTGPRRLPLITSVPHINRWLDKHPLKDDRNAPLWVEVHTQDHGNGKEVGAKASYHALKRDVERTAERAGVDKPVNFHHWRHSRATFLANRFTEAQMCEWFGWVQGSRMPGKYVHLSGRDIDSAYGAMHGKVTKEDQEVKTRPRKCNRCAFENRPEARFCDRCGSPVSPEVILELEETEDQVSEEATESDMALALRLAQAVGKDRDSFEDLLDEAGA